MANSDDRRLVDVEVFLCRRAAAIRRAGSPPAGTRRWLRGGDFGPWVLAVVVDGDVVAMARDPLTGGGLVSLGRDPLTGSARWLLADGRLLHIGDLAEIEAVVEPVGAGMPAA